MFSFSLFLLKVFLLKTRYDGITGATKTGTCYVIALAMLGMFCSLAFCSFYCFYNTHRSFKFLWKYSRKSAFFFVTHQIIILTQELFCLDAHNFINVPGRCCLRHVYYTSLWTLYLSRNTRPNTNYKI